mgnify:FL=1
MKIILFIAFILLVIVDIMLVYMIIHDLKYYNRHVPEDFILCLVGGLLFFGIAVYFTFMIGCMALN